MLKYTVYVAVGLFLLFVIVHFLMRYIGKKKKEAIRCLEMENDIYLKLEAEKTAIKNKREEHESDHPYQKFLALKMELENLKKSGNETGTQETENAIARILEEHNTDAERLAEAYQTQLNAMNRRLSEIELKQRQMRLEAASLSNILGGNSDRES